MTQEQPEALRLAEEISDLQCSTEDAAKKIAAAADELLRLHALVGDLSEKLMVAGTDLVGLSAENEALRKDAVRYRWLRTTGERMKTIAMEIEDDEILVAIKRPEAYEDVHPQLLVEDVANFHSCVEWRLIEPKEKT